MKLKSAALRSALFEVPGRPTKVGVIRNVVRGSQEMSVTMSTFFRTGIHVCLSPVRLAFQEIRRPSATKLSSGKILRSHGQRKTFRLNRPPFPFIPWIIVNRMGGSDGDSRCELVWTNRAPLPREPTPDTAEQSRLSNAAYFIPLDVCDARHVNVYRPSHQSAGVGPKIRLLRTIDHVRG